MVLITKFKAQSSKLKVQRPKAKDQLYLDSSDAESRSIKRCASGCRRKIEAGHVVATGPSIVLLIASLLAGPGTIANSLGRAMMVGIVRDNAWRGTSSIVANAPSFTCCARHTSSSSTTFTC